MARTGRQDQYIASADVDVTPVFAAQNQRCRASGHAQGFVGAGVIVVVVEYAAAPLGRPAIALEQGFERFGR
jgi:hypothetical protein